MRTSISDDNIYPNFCEQASQDSLVFNTFRINNKYKGILEHVTFQQGLVYLNLIKERNPELLSNLTKYSTNDSVGSPMKLMYDIGHFSPTTIRYIKVLGDLINEFGNLDNLDIVEIGCGYGGQSKIIMDTFNIKSYTFIDLPQVLKLTKRFLESTNVDMSKVIFKDITQLTNNENYDLIISNYAFTECVKSIQLTYFDKVINKSKMGYITANFISDIFNIDYLTKDELLSMIKNYYIKDEEPITHPNNFILLWK